MTTRTRAAIASTLIAGLELTRARDIDASQPADFAAITIRPAAERGGDDDGAAAGRAEGGME